MPGEGLRPETNSVTQRGNPADVIPKISRDIARLDPGSTAALRRGPGNGAGAAAFWKLLADYKPAGGERAWATLLQAITILTPKGRHPEKRPAHDYSLSMGKALYEAGVSELRLARLLAAPPDLRPKHAVRICRRLAGTEYSRFNLVTLGYFVLFANEKTDRRIARDYYRADAAARRKSDERETHSDA